MFILLLHPKFNLPGSQGLLVVAIKLQRVKYYYNMYYCVSFHYPNARRASVSIASEIRVSAILLLPVVGT